MRLHFLAQTESPFSRRRLAGLAERWGRSGDGPDSLEIVDTPDDAEAIVAHFHEPDDLFVWDSLDMPAGYWPGFYASLRQNRFDPTRHRSFCYIGSFNQFIEREDLYPEGDPELFFSFQGNFTSAPRHAILTADFGRKDIVIERTQPFWGPEIFDARWDEMKTRYVRTIRNSRFVLCPRGHGTSSFRLFEVMCCGRVPVIIADPWVPPAEIDWDSLSIRVGEGDVARIPAILEAYEDRWDEMGRLARKAWEDHFSPDAMGRSLVRGIRSIRATRRWSERVYRLAWPYRAARDTLRHRAVLTKIAAQRTLQWALRR
jgi:hypothetical protein